MARETKGSGDTGFPVLDSRTSGLHVCSRDVSKDCVGQSWRFLLPLKNFFVSNSQSKKFEFIQKSYVPRALRFSWQGPSRLREANKGYGDENGGGSDLFFFHLLRSLPTPPPLCAHASRSCSLCLPFYVEKSRGCGQSTWNNDYRTNIYLIIIWQQ